MSTVMSTVSAQKILNVQKQQMFIQMTGKNEQIRGFYRFVPIKERFIPFCLINNAYLCSRNETNNNVKIIIE